MLTCILGWIFIGQVIGRINVLMMSLDKETKQHNARVFDFDQYARQRKLPDALRHHAQYSLAFMSESLLGLRVSKIFRDLPKGLRVHLYFEMHAPLLVRQPMFQGLQLAQVEAIANVLYVEIYLPGDIMYECGRMGTTLFLLKKGCAEAYSPQTNIVFSAIDSGSLFGECAFFIPGAKRLASVRAVRSCQVLQLDRRKWNRLWPTDIRDEVEAKILSTVSSTYRETARAYLSITKNFYIKNENAKVPRSASQCARLRRQPTPVQRVLLASPSAVKDTGADANANTGIVTSRQSIVGIGFGISPPLDVPTPPTIENPRIASRRLSFMMPSTSAPTPHQQQSSTNSGASLHTSLAAQPSNALASGEDGSATRKTSLGAFAEAIGLRHTLKRRPSTTSQPTIIVSVPSERFQLTKRGSKRGSILPQLSTTTELRWRRHEKRLAAIRMFEVGVLRVEEDVDALANGTSGVVQRRQSVSASPALLHRLDQARAQLQTATLQRRFSLQVNAVDLRKELLAFDGFENEDVSENADKSVSLQAEQEEEEECYEHRHRRRSIENGEGSGVFTLTSFVKELMGGSRRPTNKPGLSSNKVAPSVNAKGSQSQISCEIWVPPPPGPEIFREDSRFRQTWDTIMLLVTIYYGAVIPFRACFLHDHMDDPQYRDAVIATFALEYVFTDLACVLDFVLRRHHFEFSENGEVVSDKNQIAAHYWYHGSCLIDLLSLAPFRKT